MAKKKQVPLEFRYYDMLPENPVLVLSGDSWKRRYGHDAPFFHFHNILEIGYCRQGSGEMQYERENRPYRGGTVSIIPRNVAHNTMSEGVSYWEYLFINAEQIIREQGGEDRGQMRTILERVNSRYLLFEEEYCPQAGILIKEIIREYEEQAPYCREVIRGLSYALLMLISRENREYEKNQEKEGKSNDRRIQAVLDFIQREYRQELQISDLAEIVHMSETHFRRVFVQVMDMVPVDYLNMIRVQKACELLRKTDNPMEMVAMKVGFQTMTTFNRNFKKFMGTSPYQWKKSEVIKKGREQEYNITARKGWK